MDIDIFIYQDWDMFVAKSMINWITSQWETIEKAKYNLKEAVELYYEDESENFKEEIETCSNIFISKVNINNLKPRFQPIKHQDKNNSNVKQYA